MDIENTEIQGKESTLMINPYSDNNKRPSKKTITGNKALTYISLFSSAGVGCYGFLNNGFQCIATNELIERRINVQRANKKCKYDSGYIVGDISDPVKKTELFNEIEVYKKNEKVNEVDVIIATPPCQGMSVANHKKTENEIVRNSLVVEAIGIISKVKPKFFIFENVQAFMKTKCYSNSVQMKISEAINLHLGSDYAYVDKVLNFKDYGANSSRTRTVVIGVRNDIATNVTPEQLFPSREKEKTLRDVIKDIPHLNEMGEISDNDIYHSFKPYKPHMRKWIENLSEGESAFDNTDLELRPHRLVDGIIVPNVNKNGDKYKRQEWDSVAPCIHTRNDIMSSQNTVHPTDDRVFSIRELMLLMNIPDEFKWVDIDEEELNALDFGEKRKFLKQNEINIRQSIGEAVPTIILSKIARNIANAYEMSN